MVMFLECGCEEEGDKEGKDVNQVDGYLQREFQVSFILLSLIFK